MTETQKIKVNLQLLTQTDEKLEKIGQLTYRNKGAVIDWLVAEKFEELTTPTDAPAPSTTEPQQ